MAVILSILICIVGSFSISKITSSKNAIMPLELPVHGRMDAAKRSTQGNIPPIIATVTVPNFSKHKVDSTNWYSEPFCTHPGDINCVSMWMLMVTWKVMAHMSECSSICCVENLISNLNGHFKILLLSAC